MRGAKSPEEKAVDWLLGQQASPSYRASLVAGWIVGATMTVLEINALVAQVVRMGQGTLECVLVDRIADTDDLPRTRLPVRFAVGVGVARAAPEARLFFSVDQLRGEPEEDVRRQLADLFPDGLEGDPALYLCGGALGFGPHPTDQSFLVADGDSRPAVVDLLPEAHDARLAAARDLGFRETVLPYILLG